MRTNGIRRQNASFFTAADVEIEIDREGRYDKARPNDRCFTVKWPQRHVTVTTALPLIA